MHTPDPASERLSFWRDDQIRDFEGPIPLLMPTSRDIRGRSWPADGPSEEWILDTLEESRCVWIYREGDFLRLLTANLGLRVSEGSGNKGPRLWLKFVEYATNHHRMRALSQGIQVRHEGVYGLTPQEMRLQWENKSSYWLRGYYVERLQHLINQNTPADEDDPTGTGVTTGPSVTAEQHDVLDTLNDFIEAEFAEEERLAQQTPPFHYGALKALPRKQVRRQFFELELAPEDHRRLLGNPPSLLGPMDPGGEPSGIQLELHHARPDRKRPVIHVSVERQIEHRDLPPEGTLVVAAIPTLRQVRGRVVEALREHRTANPWLLSLLANEYQWPDAEAADVDLLDWKYPPNPSQMRAFRVGARTPDCALVLGPPGTGKTTVILSWVRHFVARGQRVLVTSQNNKAVDNVLEKLVEDDTIECLRIGNEARISSTLQGALLDSRAPEIQRRMFSAQNTTLEFLATARPLLERLTAHRDELTRLSRDRDHRRRQLKEREEALQCAEDERKVFARRAGLNRKQQNDYQERAAARLEPGRHPWLEPLRRVAVWPANFADRWRAKRRERLARRLEHQERKIARTVAKRRARCEEARQTLDAVLADMAGYFPDQIADEELGRALGVPGVDDLDPAALPACMERLERLEKDVEYWFESLRNERQQSLYRLTLEHVDVVGATCVGINTRQLFRELQFDVVIVDEAGQIQPHNLIVPLSRAPKAILVGDHKQLPPVVQDEVAEEIEQRGAGDRLDLYRQSWFEHLWDRVPEDRRVMLDTQFRCPSVISDFVSEAFYEGRYVAGPGMDRRSALFSFTPGPMVFVDTRRLADRRERAQRREGRTVVQDNPKETELVVTLLRRAVEERPELAAEGEIGIIVPYANHVDRIRKALRRQQKQTPALRNLPIPLEEMVASVDSFQGQERELILFTFSRSNKGGQVGFLADWRRLNVAQTRTKGQLIMIGDSSTLARPPKTPDARDAGFKQAMALLIRRCREHGCLLDAGAFITEEAVHGS